MGRTPKSPTEKRLTKASKRKAAPEPVASTVASSTAAPASTDLKPPPWLLDKPALGVWHRIAPELHRLNILSPSDVDVFGRYCRHFADWIEATATINREGSTVLVKMTNSEERMPRMHPAVKVREVAEKHLLEIEDRFGGSPLARYRLIAQQAAHPGAFGDLFSRAGVTPDQAPGTTAPTAPAASPSPSPIGVLHPSRLN